MVLSTLSFVFSMRKGQNIDRYKASNDLLYTTVTLIQLDPKCKALYKSSLRR